MNLKSELFGVCLLVLYFGSLAEDVPAKDRGLARGFNPNIAWKTLEEGEDLIRKTKKPGMVLIHKSWCGACKSLKPKFAASKEIEELSTNFVMMNVMDDEEPADRMYAPDGGYIPRIVFVDSNGSVRKEITNPSPKSDEYKYYYWEDRSIVRSMKKMLEESKKSTTGFDEL